MCVSNLGENMMQFLTWITITPFRCIHTLPHDPAFTFPRAWQRTAPVIHALIITGNPPGIGMETSLVGWKVHQLHMCNRNHKIYRTYLHRAIPLPLSLCPPSASPWLAWNWTWAFRMTGQPPTALVMAWLLILRSQHIHNAKHPMGRTWLNRTLYHHIWWTSLRTSWKT